MIKPDIKIRKRTPIRRRFLQTVLLTTVISILAASVTGYFSILWMRKAAEDTLSGQLDINLKNIMQEKVRAIDAKLEHYEKYIEFTNDYLKSMYADKAEMIATGRMFYAPEDTDEYALTRGFASTRFKAEDMRDELLFYSHLEKIWAPTARENEDLVTTIYLGLKNGLMVSYDRYSYLSKPAEGHEMVYNYYVSEWYKQGMRTDGLFYTGVYVDSQGRGLTITLGSSVQDDKGETVGVVCMDFDLSALYEELFSVNLEDGTFSFALDHTGTIISSDSDTLDLREYTGLTLDDLDALKADRDGIMRIGGYVYVSIPVRRVNWLLCARVPEDAIQQTIHAADLRIRRAVMVFVLIVLSILLLTVVIVNKSIATIIHPLELLGRDIKTISDGDLSYRATVYRNDEIGDITSGMNEMVDRLNFTLNELLSTQQQADAMSRLATLDTLTGMRNKTAFDGQAALLKEEIASGKTEFGFALLDLNNLKVINDNYGHEKGDIAIKKLCQIVCEVFDPTHVFRVGGDEFVVLLKNEDYHSIELRVKRFQERIFKSATNRGAQPWERVSAAVGYALYDPKLDTGTETVLARADLEMYRCKRAMKGHAS